MTKALAVDESKYGVRVNWYDIYSLINFNLRVRQTHLLKSPSLSPAHVRTAMWQDIAERRDTQAKQFIREAEDHHVSQLSLVSKTVIRYKMVCNLAAWQNGDTRGMWQSMPFSGC